MWFLELLRQAVENLNGAKRFQYLTSHCIPCGTDLLHFPPVLCKVLTPTPI